MRTMFVCMLAAGAGALCLMGLAAISFAAYLDDPAVIIYVFALWCLCGMLFNRWMLSPIQQKYNGIRRLWLWSIVGCWAWPMAVVCGLALRLAPPED
ncbi:MAG: hypothetical protein KQI62_20965 [Deltaproteobacteria bacterium]|nr:hypothetical protein [Deltaproteobacteria bacterium]